MFTGFSTRMISRSVKKKVIFMISISERIKLRDRELLVSNILPMWKNKKNLRPRLDRIVDKMCAIVEKALL